MAASISQIGAAALTPDQLPEYVKAVSGLESRVIGDCLLHQGGGQAVLVAYPLRDPVDKKAMNEAVGLALALPGLEHITVLSASRPDAAPPDAKSQADTYWSLPLPLPAIPQKTASLLRRAARELSVEKSVAWTEAHAALAEAFIRRKKSLSEGSAWIFRRLGDYLAGSPETLLFSARTADGALAACAIGDFSAFSTAFYMFAFRSPAAPPGAADLLLKAIMDEAMKRGHERLNLGLGMDAGVEFFKRKWGARPFLPCHETAWPLPKKGWLSRLFGR